MEKMKYPTGLIRYTTEAALNGEPTKLIRTKFIGYLVMMLVMCAALAWSVATRTPFELDIIRDRNQLYRETSEGLVENVYTLKFLNKSQHTYSYHISVKGLNNFTYNGETDITVAAGEVFTMPISIAVDPYDLKKPITEIHFVIKSTTGTEFEVAEASRFFKGVTR